MDLMLDGEYVKARVRFLSPDVAIAAIEWFAQNRYRLETKDELIKTIKENWQGEWNRNRARIIVVVRRDGYLPRR